MLGIGSKYVHEQGSQVPSFLALSSPFFGISFLIKSMIYILWSSQCKYYELWRKFLKRGNELPNYISNIFIPNFNMRRFHLFCIWTASVYRNFLCFCILYFLHNILLSTGCFKKKYRLLFCSFLGFQTS